jgi:Sulfotransferase family
MTFKLIMISATYENGGNTLHRLLDGHPGLHVYPFESQVGTPLVSDYLSSFVPFKYRWPEFALGGTAEQDYELIYDEELKVLRTPERSKFKHCGLKMDERQRVAYFRSHLADRPRSRATILEAYFRSTFAAWKSYHAPNEQRAYLGYNPVQILDAEKILADFPDAQLIHVVRNPYSAYADTKKRPYPLSLSRYVWTWNVSQHAALTYAAKHPHQVHVVRFEDVIADPKETLTALLGKLGLPWSGACAAPSWNGQELKQVYPWGTIRVPTRAANVATMRELSEAEKAEITRLSFLMQRHLGYEGFAATGGRVLGAVAS